MSNVEPGVLSDWGRGGQTRTKARLPVSEEEVSRKEKGQRWGKGSHGTCFLTEQEAHDDGEKADIWNRLTERMNRC